LSAIAEFLVIILAMHLREWNIGRDRLTFRILPQTIS